MAQENHPSVHEDQLALNELKHLEQGEHSPEDQAILDEWKGEMTKAKADLGQHALRMLPDGTTAPLSEITREHSERDRSNPYGNAGVR